jgi:hypothetical protein
MDHLTHTVNMIMSNPDQLSPSLWTPLKRVKKDKEDLPNTNNKQTGTSGSESDSPKDRTRKYAFVIPKIEIS